jgi:hypothetical protein
MPTEKPTTPDRVTMTWNGPRGHVSETYGELVPGQTYTVSREVAISCVRDPHWTVEIPTKKEA